MVPGVEQPLAGKEPGQGAVSELLERVAVVLEFMHEEASDGGGGGGGSHLLRAYSSRQLQFYHACIHPFRDGVPYSGIDRVALGGGGEGL